MRFMILCTVLFVLTATTVEARRLMHESEYVNMTCTGSIEVPNTDGTRTDCLLSNYAVEYDFANKWAECLGQSMHYSRMTNLPPMCVLIIENKSDCKYVGRAYGLGIRVVTLDFNKLCEWERL